MAEQKPILSTVVSQGNKVPTWRTLVLCAAILMAAGFGAVSFLLWKQLGKMSETVDTLSMDLYRARSETADLTRKLVTVQAIHDQFRKRVEEKFAAQAAALAAATAPMAQPAVTAATAQPAATTTQPVASYTPAMPYVPSYTSPYTRSSVSSKKHKDTSKSSPKNKKAK